MYRVSDVLRPQFARSWYEAVAIVQEVVAQLVPGAPVPGPDDLLLDRTGVLQLGFGSDAPQDPVQALAGLLASLLEGLEAPGGLRALAVDNVGASRSVTSIESFARALAFYERPDRAGDLAAVASRLNAEPIGKSSEAAFERFSDRLGNGGDTEAEAEQYDYEEPPTLEASAARTAMPRQLAIAAAVLALATIGAIVVYARPHYLSGPARMTDHLEQKLADTIARGLNTVGSAEASSSASALPAEAPDASNDDPVAETAAAALNASGSADAKVARHAAGSSRRPETFPPSLPIRGQLPSAVNAPSALPEVFLGMSAGSNVSEPVASSGTTAFGHLDADGLVAYSEADEDVVPPRISRQQLPRKPEPGADTGYFDVIISETGIVERVQLVSPMRRFQERMLMAAAKAWTFRPAMRDGQPVRYRLRIAIILSDKP